MDFEEVRHYQAGDDIRTMDWRVTARTGKPHTKIFREEKERPLFILCDLSPSLFFATQGAFKSVIAAQTSAFLAWCGSYHGDRVGGIVFSGEAIHEFRPQARKQGVLPLLKTLSEISQQTPAHHHHHFEKALFQLRHVTKPGSLVFIISDFLQLTDTVEAHIRDLKQQCEVVCCWISDPIEFTPPPAGRYTVTDGATLATLDTREKKFCEDYQNFFDHYHQSIETTICQYRIPLIKLSTARDPIKQLQQYFGG